MDLVLIASLSTVCLFVGMVVLSDLGRRIGIAKLARDPDGLTKGAGPGEAAVFGLLGLLLAFTFSGAASRFEARRHLVTAEANAISTAYRRVDLLPADTRIEIRRLFRRYLEVRLATFQDEADLAATNAKLAEAATLQSEIWTKTLAACQHPDVQPKQACMQMLLPALNDMINVTTTRVTASRNHPPPIVFGLLGGLSLIGALLLGYGTSPNKNRSWFHMVIFAFILSLTIYVIVDLEFPRLGLIRVDAADQVLADLRKIMR